jgi:hypothetical protein
MFNPVRVLALAVIKQAMIDYRNGVGEEKMIAAKFLAGDGKEILAALGFRPALIDEFLANPASFGTLRSELGEGKGRG